MRPFLVLAALLSFSTTSLASAEDQTGFGDLPWGSPRATVVDRLVKSSCGWSIALEKIGEDTIACYDYPLESVGPVVLNLDFRDDLLQGYTILVPGRRFNDFRSWVKKRLGEPVQVMQFTGEISTWQWPSGATAVFRQHCMRPGEACLSLSAPGAKRSQGRHSHRPGS